MLKQPDKGLALPKVFVHQLTPTVRETIVTDSAAVALSAEDKVSAGTLSSDPLASKTEGAGRITVAREGTVIEFSRDGKHSVLADIWGFHTKGEKSALNNILRVKSNTFRKRSLPFKQGF